MKWALKCITYFGENCYLVSISIYTNSIKLVYEHFNFLHKQLRLNIFLSDEKESTDMFQHVIKSHPVGQLQLMTERVMRNFESFLLPIIL